MSQYDRLLFAGDPHGNFNALITAVHKHRPEAVVMLGDYDLEQPLETYLAEILDLTQVWWIAGNHDFETPCKYHNLFHSALAHKSLHLKVTEVAGLRIAGLGGIFLGRVWYPPQVPKWRNKQEYLEHQAAHIKNADMSLKYRSAIWHDEFEALRSLKADILVTHEAPGSHRHGFAVIGELAAAMGVKHIFHGHLHENYTRIIKQHIHVFGVANRTVTNLRGQIVSDIKACHDFSY
ncbi:metallophosphoesterase family protein [Methylovulum psychrotolerans]|uniref:Metallophosphoesterase n=1 Tax=Methylovulum psychrotolerans TaxID=1704499 RepID=A0A1Z4BUI0_9GAMM|nr:metallophosphoesterase [Methylovulum psychrotolerans]ASF44965.1 metallophosphoesterase [Methylovulum psychrotolerans]POZ53939.1 metallophosphoesterase [Methylovulum psychrotolerans]